MVWRISLLFSNLKPYIWLVTLTLFTCLMTILYLHLLCVNMKSFIKYHILRLDYRSKIFKGYCIFGSNVGKHRALILYFFPVLKKAIWRISVRLPDRSKIKQNIINFIKNCPPPPSGFEPTTSSSSLWSWKTMMRASKVPSPNARSLDNCQNRHACMHTSLDVLRVYAHLNYSGLECFFIKVSITFSFQWSANMQKLMDIFDWSINPTDCVTL